jgi:hypothetical protein
VPIGSETGSMFGVDSKNFRIFGFRGNVEKSLIYVLGEI